MMNLAKNILDRRITPDCLAFLGDDHSREVVGRVAHEVFGAATVADGGVRNALDSLTDAAPPETLIVDIGENPEHLTPLLSLCGSSMRETRLIAVGSLNDVAIYRDLIEAGAADYLVKPITEPALRAALSRRRMPRHDDDPAAEKKVHKIVVVGAQGGVGASTIALNLAWLSAEVHEKQTVLVDLDLEFGTAALALDLEPTRGLREALENPGRIDSLFVSSATARVGDRFCVMSTEETFDQGFRPDPAAIEALLGTLEESNDCVIVDLPRSAFDLRHGVFQAATQVVLVSDLSLRGLRDTARLIDIVRDAAPEVPVTVVANRTGAPQQAISVAEFKKTLGRNVDLQIPEEHKALAAAITAGKPLAQSAPDSKAAKALRGLAARLLRTPDETGGAKKGSKVSWLRLIKRG